MLSPEQLPCLQTSEGETRAIIEKAFARMTEHLKEPPVQKRSFKCPQDKICHLSSLS